MEKIKIYYRFDGEPHPARINVYRNGAHPRHMPQRILNIGMQASLAFLIVINGFHLCRIGLPGTEWSTSPAARNIIIRCTK